MDKRALSLINSVLGEAFGKLYVQKYFSPEAKQEMEILISYLKKAYHKHISELEWMSSETKTKALDKLHKFSVKVAYPNKWEDYSKLVVESPKNMGVMLNSASSMSKTIS